MENWKSVLQNRGGSPIPGLMRPGFEKSAAMIDRIADAPAVDTARMAIGPVLISTPNEDRSDGRMML
jgi:hypothetical protein